MTPAMEAFVETIGIGFGPAAIAVAAALEDEREATGLARPVLFLEARERVEWQPGMLLRGTDIQHNYLRDLATPRNPRSRFTFANYLKEHDRIYEFGELTFGEPGGAVSRLEWSDYIGWAADALADWALLGQRVERVSPVRDGEAVVGFRVETGEGAFRCRNLIVSSGREPAIPDCLTGLPDGLVIHPADYRERVERLSAGEVRDVAIVGGGQSAVEVAIDLHDRFPGATLHVLHRGPGFRHVDLSQFSNHAFHPEAVDAFHALPSARRRELLAELRPLLYGVCDAEAASDLYRRAYEDMVVGASRVRLHTFSHLGPVLHGDDGLMLRVTSGLDGTTLGLRADRVVACTGFHDAPLGPHASELEALARRDEEGEIAVSRDYELLLEPPCAGQVFVAGTAEATHGAGDSASFSLMAVRAERIAGALRSGAATAAVEIASQAEVVG